MTSILALASLSVGFAEPDIDDIVQKTFKDASFVIRVVSSNQKELAKIKKEFGTQYRFKDTKVWVEEPHRLRVESKAGDTTVLYIVNGAKRWYRIPRLNVTQSEDNTNAPGKRQTFLDFGVLTPSIFADPFAAKYVRTDRTTGAYVFDITYKMPRYDDTSRHRIWVDPQKKYVEKREWYAQDGHQLATFFYEEPVNKAGIWFPTKLSVKNVEGKLGAVTTNVDLVVNAGIPDTMFKFK